MEFKVTREQLVSALMEWEKQSKANGWAESDGTDPRNDAERSADFLLEQMGKLTPA